MASITGWGRSTWSSGAWSSSAPVEVTGVSSASGIGSVTVNIGISFSVTGVSAASAIGSAGVPEVVGVTGVSAEGLASNAMVWTSVPDSQTPSWAAIDDSQTPSWAAIDASQTPSWTKIAA